MKPNIPHQAYQTKPTKPNLPNQTYQTNPNLHNPTDQTKSNLPNQTYQSKPTKPNLQINLLNLFRNHFSTRYVWISSISLHISYQNCFKSTTMFLVKKFLKHIDKDMKTRIFVTDWGHN